MRFAHADTTSYSLDGQYDSDSDTEEVKVTYGYSKDKRQDLKQVVQELVTSQDGGIPFMTKAYDGNASNSVILRERATKLIEEFNTSQSRIFIADSKLYSEKSAETLNKINFITRVPSIIKLEHEMIEKALSNKESWVDVDKKGYKFQEFFVDCYGIANQRWIIINSMQAQERVKKTIEKEIVREKKQIEKELFHLQAQLFECEIDAQKQFEKIRKKWKFHQPNNTSITPINQHSNPGRPKTEPKNIKFKIKSEVELNQSLVDKIIDQRSCFVLATNVDINNLSMQEVLSAYKEQDKTEKGFSFLKNPEFFTSSLFLKKPSRIDGLLMIMVLSLLVYSVAQRRLRIRLNASKLTVPIKLISRRQILQCVGFFNFLKELIM